MLYLPAQRKYETKELLHLNTHLNKIYSECISVLYLQKRKSGIPSMFAIIHVRVTSMIHALRFI